MEQELYLPSKRYFDNENSFSGSYGDLRFFLKPGSEVILAKIWKGPLCMEKSTILEEREFPLSNEGLSELRDYLKSKEII